MILRRLIILSAVVSGLAVSGGVVIVGLNYSIFTLLTPRLGVAGACAVMVAVFAVLLWGGAAALFALSRPKKVVVVEAAPSPVARIFDTVAETVRERPVIVILAAVGAGILAVRNPLYLASALRAFTAPRDVED